jgi:[acyl-carrier-protein] S-malonyltransferase
MSKIAFLFAGQGSQYVGMGKELYDNFSSVKRIYDEADDILNTNIKDLCFNGPEDILSKTDNTQPCMLTTAFAISSLLNEKGIMADYAAGLSLGEYSALVYGGVFNFEEGLRLIQKRGKLMQNAVPNGIGGMAAIMGLEAIKIETYCKEYNGTGIVEIANYNCPGQIVITGEKVAVEKAAIDLKALGALKTVVLNVSGPFHSSLMKNAGMSLEDEISRVCINKPNKNILSNFDNEYYEDDANKIIYKLKNQVSSSVRWEDNIRRLINDGVDVFIEIGPGKTLTSFLKKIDKTKVVYNVEDIKSLEKLQAELYR